MKQLPCKVKNRATPLFALFIAFVILAFAVSEASAYETYSGCESCHGDFRSSPYISLADGTDWGNDLHDIHAANMLSNDCNVCHTSGDRSPVYLGSSTGGNGMSAISCVGCHGREEDIGNDSVSAGRGAGLRQHHAAAGQTGCQSCHSDANPANFTPVGEDVLPEYFVNPGTGHPNIPMDSCNPTGEEDFAGAVTGLDNDGDGVYDTADSDCMAAVAFKINSGLSDAWYDPDTDGQGFFITVLPDIGVMALAWFTYDTELPPEDATSNLGDPGNRWMTGSGPYADDQAVLSIVLTSGGIFDTPGGVERTDPPGSDGTFVVTFDSCNSGVVEYDITSIDRQGTVPIQRISTDNVGVCEALNAQ